jgi:hypothetical protein
VGGIETDDVSRQIEGADYGIETGRLLMPAYPASLLTSNLILRGDLLNVTPTPLTTAQGGTAPQGGTFSFSPEPGGNAAKLMISAKSGAGGTATPITGVLLASDDNGTTWLPVVSALALATGPVLQDAVAGRLYALSLSAVTLNGSSGVSLFVAVS